MNQIIPNANPPDTNGPTLTLAPEDIPNIDDIVIEDGAPVESLFAEKLLRLLTETLYSSWPGPGEGRTFRALSNVGLFYKVGQPPLVPDVMLSLDVDTNLDLSRKENRSYFLWVVGKFPEVVVEVVSDRLGGELTIKKRDYARIGIPYYVVFDPLLRLGEEVLYFLGLNAVKGVYEPLGSNWLERVGLGLTLWQGVYEEQEARWLRWCDRQGKVIPTGRERADEERQRGDAERQRADEAEQRNERLRAQLRALGVEPAE